MTKWAARFAVGVFGLLSFLTAGFSQTRVGTSWTGTLRDAAGNFGAAATISLHSPKSNARYTATSSSSGTFTFESLPPDDYELSVRLGEKSWKLSGLLTVTEAAPAAGLVLELPREGQELRALYREEVSEGSQSGGQASGGERLSSKEVSSIPLNERDFSKLLLLAAGTMTDANGAANFTQQFAVNGQRGTATVFALDNADTTDPEMGGATFSNFNVDAIQEVQSNSGVMPAEIGHGAAGYTNVVSKSGTNAIHGSAFEFLRNAAFDARNYFDRPNVADERRLPPFVRNEFGVTVGGPVVLGKLYDGRDRTFFFGEYQGFRQVLGTTQVFPVPTAAERQGFDTTAFPGDTLTVPIDPRIAAVLAGYPLPNDPQGAYGARTYAASSKVQTNTDQFSIRVDHRISDKASLFARFSLNQVTGPTTNPDQTAIDPSFGIRFFDHQRSAAVRYVRSLSTNLLSDTSIGYIRSTPFFPTVNKTQPAIAYGDGAFEGFNSAGGSIFGSYGNLYQFKEDMSLLDGTHAFKWGVELRFNRDSTIFGVNPNGAYTFGGGTAFSPVLIPSSSGTHDILPGDPLPDSLTGLLTATPYSFGMVVAAPFTPQGDMFDAAAVRRQAYNFYFQDAWKISPHLTVTYGLRYEYNSRIKEARERTSLPKVVGPDGQDANYFSPGAQQIFLYNPQPPYDADYNGWGPRAAADFGLTSKTVLHAGASLTTLLTNLWQDNAVTGAIPFVVSPFITAEPGVPITFQNTAISLTPPTIYTTDGQPLFSDGVNPGVPANTPLDLIRYQNDLAALTPGNQTQLLTMQGFMKSYRNGSIGTWTFGLDHDFGPMKMNVAYVGTVGMHLTSLFWPNSYGGAESQFAPFTQFDPSGHALSGFGPESIISSGSHSTYHALQAGLTQAVARAGLSFQASYTFSKSIDDTSAVLGNLLGASGTVLQTPPQNPWNPRAEKSPSTFDVTHVFTVNAIQSLPFERLGFLAGVNTKLTAGWQLLNVTTITSGPPFTVYSGIQQTGAGAGGTDRPDLLTMPEVSTSRKIREDYFGRGADNSSFFSIPIGISGGTGPNQGRFGTLGRGTFRGPGFHQFDFALIKDTPFGRRGKSELMVLQFRAEFFNVFNIVNFGLPSNIVKGSGFGQISKTAGSSRQIQFSLRLMF